jgi:hypothetical protein
MIIDCCKMTPVQSQLLSVFNDHFMSLQPYIACGVYVGYVDRKHTWTPGLTAVHSDGHVARVAHTWAWMKRDLGPTT